MRIDASFKRGMRNSECGRGDVSTALGSGVRSGKLCSELGAGSSGHGPATAFHHQPTSPGRLKSNLAEPGSTLMAIFMLVPIVIPVIITVVSFMSPMVAVIHRYKNGKTTAGYDQQDPDYYQSDFFHDSLVILLLFLSSWPGFLTTDAAVRRNTRLIIYIIASIISRRERAGSTQEQRWKWIAPPRVGTLMLTPRPP
jgi:hypothetical protein